MKKYYKLQKKYNIKPKTKLGFGISLIGAIAYFIINYYCDNWLMKFINSNLIAQAVLMFLVIGTAISVFLPFTIREDLSSSDVENITKEVIEDVDRENKENEKIKRDATL